ncbi:MAG: hypothetical protein AAGK05_12790 [Pseudomonadota bacterium]
MRLFISFQSQSLKEVSEIGKRKEKEKQKVDRAGRQQAAEETSEESDSEHSLESDIARKIAADSARITAKAAETQTVPISDPSVSTTVLLAELRSHRTVLGEESYPTHNNNDNQLPTPVAEKMLCESKKQTHYLRHLVREADCATVPRDSEGVEEG